MVTGTGPPPSPSLELYNTGGGGGSSGGGSGGGGGGESAEQRKARECENMKLTAETEADRCATKIKDEKARTHSEICVDRKSYTGSVSVSFLGKVISGLLGASVTSDDYTKCTNQLTFNADALIGKCAVARSEAVEEACTG